MQFSEFKAKTKKWNQFSQIDTLGSYDFYTSIVSFDSLKQADIIQMKNAFNDDKNLTRLDLGRKITPQQFELLKKILPLAAHEYTHFVDATSTLWGLRHLNMMNAAYLADNAKGGIEYDFHHAKSFYDHIRLVRLPNYYTLINSNATHTMGWRSTITCGKIFSNDGSISDRPVMFSRFESETGTLLARSPISTISILEASAMAQEVMFHTSLINLTSEDFKTIETIRYNKELLNYLYNHNITEYSVCVHLVANHLNCKDILVSFTICALLTRIVLNFPNQAFKQVIKNCKFNEILEIPSGEYEFINYIRSGVETRDLGTLFYLLCRALPKDSSESPSKSLSGVNEGLKKIGIRIEELPTIIMNDAIKLANPAISSPIKSLSLLAEAGLNNLRKIDSANPNLRFNNLDLPPAWLDESEPWLPFGASNNMLANLDLDVCFNELYAGQEWVNRFAEACL